MKWQASPNRAGTGSALLVLAIAWGMGVTAPAAADELDPVVLRGGRLYDNWFKEVGTAAPQTRHPAYPADKAYADDPATTWRCKECHGWDYRGRDGAYGSGRHATGIKGIRGLAGAKAEDVTSILKDETHAYGKLLDEDDFKALAAFVAKGQVDMQEFIDRSSKKAKGDPVRHADYYNVICANCHGADGSKVGTIAPLGRIANDDPWESLHKILNGHPGGKMPALSVFGTQALTDILAYVQTLPQQEKLLASIDRGGRLYDNWYKEIGAAEPRKRHPAYPADKAFADNPAVTWRCQECHGWDYQGRDGAYASGPHFTGIKGIRGKAGADPTEIIALLRGRPHLFRDLMEDRDFQDLANFVIRGQVAADQLVDRTSRKAKGDPAKRESYFTAICANCHGADGLAIRTMPPLGKVGRDDPWQALHKIVNGHPGGKMPALRMLEMPILVDVLAYIQTLPEAEPLLASIVRGGRLYDNWYQEKGAAVPDKPHPAYPSSGAFAKDPGATWRCKECHGWDYLGRDGAYGSGNHVTGIKGILYAADKDPNAIIAALKGDLHGFDKVLDDFDLRDLANFVAKGQVEMNRMIGRDTGLAKGDTAKRQAFYTTICANCHGGDGRQLRGMLPLGKVARENPWQTLHTIFNGHAGGKMPGLRTWKTKVLVDVLAHTQTLPSAR